MSLELSVARACADRAIALAEGMGVKIALAVTDDTGVLVQLDRMDGAPLAALDLAEAKALTALSFQQPTEELAQAFGPVDLEAVRQAVHFTVVTLPGGVTIVRQGEVVGAIGVSGATGGRDARIAAGAAGGS